MTVEHEEDDDQVNEQEDEGDDAGEQAVAEVPRTRGGLIKAAKERLHEGGDLMVAGPTFDWLFRGSRERSPQSLGSLLMRVNTLMQRLDAPNSLIESLDIANSVRISLRPSDIELRRSIERRDAALALELDDPRQRDLLRQSVPSTFVAGELALELMNSSLSEEDEPVRSALRFGRGAAEAFRVLTDQLAEEEYELWTGFSGIPTAAPVVSEPVEFSNDDLRVVARRLSAPGIYETFSVTAVGVMRLSRPSWNFAAAVGVSELSQTVEAATFGATVAVVV